VRENARDDLGLLDAGDDPELAAAAGALFDLDPEDPLQSARAEKGDSP
jgi:hypothetical protein